MRFVPSLTVGLLAASLGSAAVAAPGPRPLHDDVLGDVLVSCRAGPPRADVKAETQSGVPLNSRYAVDRGANKGLVRLMSRGGRSVRTYSIPASSIRALVEVRVEQTLPEYAVLAFEATKLVMIHTSTGDAGIFTASDVFELPYAQGRPTEGAVKADVEATAFLKLGLAAYSSADGRCPIPAG